MKIITFLYLYGGDYTKDTAGSNKAIGQFSPILNFKYLSIRGVCDHYKGLVK